MIIKIKVLEYLEFTQLSNPIAFDMDVQIVLEYLEFTQLSNDSQPTWDSVPVLEYLEFTQLSNSRRTHTSAGAGFRVLGIYTALKLNRSRLEKSLVLEYLEFTQLSNKRPADPRGSLVLEYLEFTQLSNASRVFLSFRPSFRVLGIYTALKLHMTKPP